MGVIDGHDVRALRRALREALAAERPVVVHCATVKGKGFAPAEEGGLEGMEKWHAAKPKSIANGAPAKARRTRARRQARAAGLHAGVRRGARRASAARRAGDRDHRGDELRHRAEHPPAGELPDRYFDVGIAEQQAVLFAAGLALQGCKPVAAIYSTFLQRAYDQIVHDVCLQKLNVVFAMDRAGPGRRRRPDPPRRVRHRLSACLPNIVLMAPRDEAMLVHMLHTALRYDDGPIALRYPRGEGVGRRRCRRGPQAIEIGTGEILREAGAGRPSARVALLGYGTGVGKALEAADILAAHGISVTVADARFAKPIDAGLAAQLAAEHELLVTVEEGVLAGGFGSAVWETLSDAGIASARSRSCASGCPTATSPTAPRGCCTRRSASRASGSPSGSWPRWPSAAGSPQRARSRARCHRLSAVRAITYRSAEMRRVRLDHLLSERGMFPSRTRAAASVLAGEVLLAARAPAGREARAAGRRGRRARARAQAPEFVSRGGVKLANALDALRLAVDRPPGARRRRLDRRLHRLPAPARRRARGRARRRLRPARLAAALRSAGDRDRAPQRPRR